MDIVHHSLIGGSGFLIASAVDQPLAGTAFVMGSVFPDLDVVFIILGKRFYLRNHQAITHLLFLAPVYSLVIYLGFFFTARSKLGLADCIRVSSRHLVTRNFGLV